ncbi:MAG: neutral/alkaline non-lysosomal ceramidase N-terminal domain-containing protein [Chthoniobacteraceae bacterium]
MRSPHLALLLAGLICAVAPARAQEFKAGVGRADITPQEPVWLGGYEGRRTPSIGIEQRINVKALALQDTTGATTLIVTADTIGTPRSFTEAVAEQVEKELHVPRDRFLLASSHSHATPVMPPALIDMYPLDAEQRAALDRYAEFFKAQALAAARTAIADLQPARLQFSRGEAGFAVNRRAFGPKGVGFGVNPTGLVDHEVPVLRVLGEKDALKAVVLGYACHCTTLGPDTMKVCGDWATYAQDYLEEAYPGATAFFITGCGADANPNPRTGVPFARQHGLELAGSVARALKEPPINIGGPITTAFERVDLPISTPPTKEEFTAKLTDKRGAVQRHAQRHIAMLERGEKLMSSYPCPVQILRFGQDLTLIALGGEVVVDYAYRLRRELPTERLWVAAYCNDVFAYVPSMRILTEGGYEADFNLIYYGLPARFAPEVEDTLVKKVIELTKRTGAPIPAK